MKRLLTYFKNLRFKQKLFISYLVVCIIPVIALGFFSYYQASKLLLQQAKQNLDDSVSQIASNINFRCTQHEAIVNSVTQNIVFKQIFSNNYDNFPVLYRDYVDPFFSNILNFNKDILQISVFTGNSDIQRGEYILPIKLINEFQWFANSESSKETQWYGNNGKFICTRLFANDDSEKQGKLPAILFLNIDGDSLFKGLDEIKSTSYGVAILDKHGKEILYKEKDIKVESSNYIEDLQNLKDKNGYFKIDNTQYIYIKEDIKQTGWTLYFFIPKRTISYDARSIVEATALIIVVCLVVLILIIWMFSSTFVKRIIKLNEKMIIVENGNLKINVASNSKDEIGELTNRFGKMLKNINILIDEVYQSKITQKEAELRALQTQINPHFLYNTLSIINWKALQIDATEISEIVNVVSKFYRTVLNKGKDSILVRDEVENAKAYMHIQLIMHHNNFDFICDIDEELYHYHIINLVFQPILENALEHGIDAIKRGGPRGQIVLKGHFRNDNLEFLIEDNGPGMSAELINEVLARNSKGYGLKNVHDRIQILFGSDYGLKIDSAVGQGTRIYVTFPKNTAPEPFAEE